MIYVDTKFYNRHEIVSKLCCNSFAYSLLCLVSMVILTTLSGQFDVAMPNTLNTRELVYFLVLSSFLSIVKINYCNSHLLNCENCSSEDQLKETKDDIRTSIEMAIISSAMLSLVIIGLYINWNYIFSRRTEGLILMVCLYTFGIILYGLFFYNSIWNDTDKYIPLEELNKR